MILSNYHVVSMNIGVSDVKHRMWKVFVDAPYDSGRVGLLLL